LPDLFGKLDMGVGHTVAEQPEDQTGRDGQGNYRGHDETATVG